MVNSIKDFQTVLKEFMSSILVLITSLYVAAKGSPMAYIAGCVTVIIAIAIFLIVKKVLYERKKRNSVGI